MRFRWASVALLLVTGGCDAFRTHPYAVPQDEWLQDLTRKNLSRLAQLPQEETFTFAALGDTQRWEDETRDAIASINTDPDVQFVIQVGDITEFGLGREYIWMNEYYREAKVPFLTVVGNHDLLGNGGTIYESVFGPKNYTFRFGAVKFVMLDSNSREYDPPARVPDLDWLERELLPDAGWEQAIVVAHVPFDDGDFRRDLEAPYREIVQRHGNVALSLHGHAHGYRDETLDGIRVVVADDMEDRGWTKIRVSPGGLTAEQVFF